MDPIVLAVASSLAAPPLDHVSQIRPACLVGHLDVDAKLGETCTQRCDGVADWPGPNGTDGRQDIFDIIFFLADVEAGDAATDLNGDTVLDVFDVLRFLSIFDSGGC